MPPGRTVFVGNIPYGLSEEVLRETLSRVGTVVSWRLVLDKETGKPKGFGFAEYLDHDSASSAVRNLNDTEFMGRKLRVDWSNDGDRTSNLMSENNANGTQGGAAGASDAQLQSGALPDIPNGIELPPGVSAPDQISKTLLTIPPPQLLDIVSQMKHLVTTEPAQAAALLRAQPQFSYAVFQALLILDIVNHQQLASILAEPAAGGPAPAPVPAAPPVQAPAPQLPIPPPPQPQIPVPQPSYASQFGQVQQPQYVPTPPAPPMYQPVPPPQQYQQPVHAQPVQQADAAVTQAALIQQIINMPQQQVDLLPPEQRAQIMALKAQYGVPGY